ncbi:hypothetical protein BGX34_003283, partial [Mortierella sp. NVP85]
NLVLAKNAGMANTHLLDTLSNVGTEQKERRAPKWNHARQRLKSWKEKSIQSAQSIMKFKKNLVSFRKGTAKIALETAKAALHEGTARRRDSLAFHAKKLKIEAETMSLRRVSS